MKNNIMDTALNGTPVDVAVEIATIEQYIFDKKGKRVKIKNPEAYLMGVNDVFNFNSQLRAIHAAFSGICVLYKGGKYEPQ